MAIKSRDEPGRNGTSRLAQIPLAADQTTRHASPAPPEVATYLASFARFLSRNAASGDAADDTRATSAVQAESHRLQQLLVERRSEALALHRHWRSMVLPNLRRHRASSSSRLRLRQRPALLPMRLLTFRRPRLRLRSLQWTPSLKRRLYSPLSLQRPPRLR